MISLVFLKQVNGQIDKSIFHWETFSDNYITEKICRKGTVCLIPRSGYNKIRTSLKKYNFLDCGIKGETIELFRALRLKNSKDKTSPRRLIVNISESKGLKKSLNAFIEKWYQSDDPPCLLIIGDSVTDELTKGFDARKMSTPDKDPISSLLSAVSNEQAFKEISANYLGVSPIVKITHLMIYRASLTASSVLILGESGTGKDMIARLIYDNSKQYRKNFFVVNCSAFPETLIESEMFGHIKGSFTGAIETKTGLFVAAEGGTIFLDEIGDLSLLNQAKILHAVENQEIRPIGSNESIKVDVRIIAATNRNLGSMIKQETFREDLYFRLNTFSIFSPPLREHPEDIPLIASAIWFGFRPSNPLSPEFQEYLKNYDWPGNVRELKTMLNRIRDVFGDISPNAEHIEAIRNYGKNRLIQSKSNKEDDYTKSLKAESRNRLINAQNIIREIKIKLRPIINNDFRQLSNKQELQLLRSYLSRENEKLEELCKEPIYLKNWELFHRITRFHYLLGKTIDGWPKNKQIILKKRIPELEELYHKIDKEIFDIVWSNMDM
jgi:DNA-binding NtrC family response regulator